PSLPSGEAYTSFRIDHFPQAIGGGDWEDKNVAIRELTLESQQPNGEFKTIKLKNPRATFSQRGWNVASALDGKVDSGWGLSPKFKEAQAAVFDFESPITGGTLKVTLEQQYGEGLLLARSRFSISQNPIQWLRAELNPEPEKVFRETVFPETIRRIKAMETATNQLQNFKKQIPSTPVMFDLDAKRQRTTRIHNRGNFLDQGEQVTASVLTTFANFPADAPANRIGVAHWLMAAENPLTARVTVNRIWARLFGTGLVETEEDFGTQGMAPSHPELLDWLALEFIQSGWNIKQFHKLIMMSATYQQSSKVTPQQLQRDPENRLLSRGPRFRLDAEVIRDNALATSGLLVRDVGGKSVRPYQPSGLWKAVGFGGSNTSVFAQDKGEKLYRRSMYTFWKRTSPPPSMSTFDAPDRETCQVRRARTNTPLQSLVLMNDVQFVEAARKLAERVLREGGSTPAERFVFAFRTTTSRFPESYERDSLILLHKEYLEEFQSKPENAEKLLSAGESPRDTDLPVADLAAWTMVCHLLLNLSETVTQN
ncbi:MAG: DUF1553 domain-containing protein, partial [Rubripirellula sp.]